MTVAPAASRGRRAAKRAQILAAASRAFADRPYHLVSMDDVAEAARVGKGTLYRYYPSKAHLHLAIVAEAFDLLIGRLDEVEAAGLPPETALPRMIQAIVETFARHLPYFRLMQQSDARLFLRKKEVIRARRQRIAALLARVLERGAEAGVFRKVDVALVPSMLIGLVWGSTLNHAGEVPAAILGPKVAELCLHGVLQPSGARR
jgi:AcrR family transcriptional regulator